MKNEKPFIYSETLKKIMEKNRDNEIGRKKFISEFSRLQHIPKHLTNYRIIPELRNLKMIEDNKHMIKIIA